MDIEHDAEAVTGKRSDFPTAKAYRRAIELDASQAVEDAGLHFNDTAGAWLSIRKMVYISNGSWAATRRYSPAWNAFNEGINRRCSCPELCRNKFTRKSILAFARGYSKRVYATSRLP